MFIRDGITISDICTDPLFGWGVTHSAAQPYALASIKDGKVVAVHGRYSSLRSARNAMRRMRDKS